MKRRGFTLIELMVVIAIIIILAAIAIPNYLNMTARAKRSRVASDFAALATALETYRTDWNQYPVGAASPGVSIILPGSPVNVELTGSAAASGGVNWGTTAGGETAPIEYMTGNVLKSMINPFSNLSAAEYKYIGNATGTHWLLIAPTLAVPTAGTALSRNDETTTLTGPSTALGLPSDT